MQYNYIGKDQYGTVYWIKKYPRKELLEEFGMKHCDKMYISNMEGESFHIGYVIGGHWIHIYKLSFWKPS